MIRVIESTDEKAIAAILDRSPARSTKVERAVARIVADVRARGDAAVAEYARRFDGLEGGFEVSRGEMTREAGHPSLSPMLDCYHFYSGLSKLEDLDQIKPGEIVLDGPTLSKIFMGEIKSWTDPAIIKLNPTAKLPAQAIVVVHRSDGSGTTFIWTDYLSKVSNDWKTKVGANTAVEWPVGLGARATKAWPTT